MWGFYFYVFDSSAFSPLSFCHQVPIRILLLYFYLLSVKAAKSPIFPSCVEGEKNKKEINGCYINGAREGGRRHPVLLDGKDGKVVGRERMESLGLIHLALPGVTE